MRKIIHIFLSLVIVYAGTVSAYASTSTGGWTAVDTVIAGATNTINATKTAGGKVLTSAVTVAPSAVKVGKHLIKGGGAAALAFAMVELADGALDWVLDPANNRVIVNTSTPADSDVAPAGKMWATNDISSTGASTPGASCALAKRLYPYTTGAKFISGKWLCVDPTTSRGGYEINLRSGTGADGGVAPDNKRYIPIETVAAKVISNAEAGHGPSQEAVKAVALEGFAAGDHDAALESAAVESDAGTDAGTDNPTDPNNPTDPQDPAVPFDPSSIIAAINALKALLAGILSSITGLSDLFNDTPPEKTQEETDVPVEAPPEVKNPNEFDVDYIGFSSQCPTLSPFSVGIGGASSTMTFDMTPLCNLAVTIRPAIIAIAYFIGLGVIASAIRET